MKQYGDMQLITEAYDILKRGFGMHEKEIADIFERWNKGVLDSYLIEITTEILRYNDDDGVPLVTKIKDAASQKGTGKWTATNALDLGMPVTLIGEAVFARCLSSIKDERVRASKKIGGPQIEPFTGDKKQFIDDLEQALYASKIISYAQGFMLMREAAKDYGWHLNNAGIALMWRGGCIIRSVFLGDITKAFQKTPDLENLLFDDFFNKAIHTAQPGWRRIVAQGALWGIPTPAFSTALSFFDGYRTERLPASLLQAQRDYFGAHTFRVLPQFASEKYPEGKDIHVNVSPGSLVVGFGSEDTDSSARPCSGLAVVATSRLRPTTSKRRRPRLRCRGWVRLLEPHKKTHTYLDSVPSSRPSLPRTSLFSLLS